MRDDDGRGDRADLLSDQLCVLVRDERRVVRKLDGMRGASPLRERTNDSLPSGRSLPRAVDQDDVAHADGNVAIRGSASARLPGAATGPPCV